MGINLDERKKETRIINEKFQKIRKINKILAILIAILMVTLIILRNAINNSFEPHTVENLLGKINGIVVIVLFIIFAFNLFRAMSMVKKIKTMFSKEEIEEAMRKNNEINNNK